MSAAATPDPVDWAFGMPRLRARLMDERDRDLYRALYTDPAMMTHIGQPLSVAEADAMFAKVLRWNREVPMRARYWRVERREDGDAVGMQSILRAETAPDVVELGLMILPGHQGRRYGHEITAAVLDRLFDPAWALGTATVVARHLPANVRIERLGVALRFEETATADGSARGIRLTRAAWEAFRTASAAPPPASGHRDDAADRA